MGLKSENGGYYFLSDIAAKNQLQTIITFPFFRTTSAIAVGLRVFS